MFGLIDKFAMGSLMWKEYALSSNRHTSYKFIECKGSDKLILFFPHWLGKSSNYSKYVKDLKGYSMYLFDYPGTILSTDLRTSVKVIKDIANQAIELIHDARKKGYKEIILFGSSFGSAISIKVATKIKVDKLIINSFSDNQARIVFEIKNFKRVKKVYEAAGVDFETLDEIMAFISVDHNIDRLRNKHLKIFLASSGFDPFCTKKNFDKISQKIKNLYENIKISYHPYFGHLLSMYVNLKFKKNRKEIIEFINE